MMKHTSSRIFGTVLTLLSASLASCGQVVSDPSPTIVSISPADGEMGVLADTNIVITFSEPMNKTFTQSAYQSADIAPADAVFTWDSTGTVLTVNPNTDLLLATDSNPATLVANGYSFLISTNAEGEAGNALAAQVDVTFFTLRHIVDQVLLAADHALSGNWRSDNSPGMGSCNTEYCVGDSKDGSLNEDYYYFLGLTFDLSAVATGATLGAATLSANQVEIRGAPYDTLGRLNLEHVSYSVLDSISVDSLFLVTPLVSGNPVGELSTSATLGIKTVDILSQVDADWGNGKPLSQFRARWTVTTDGDGTGDFPIFTARTVRFSLSYHAP